MNDLLQRQKLERSLCILRYLRALIEEAVGLRGARKELVVQEVINYCRAHRRETYTVITEAIVDHFARGEFHIEVVKQVFKSVEDLEAEQVALGYVPPRKEDNAA